ncbi:MAG: hypothetical protein HRU29_11355 [Rhizobiales bacterium]|nr:hypothetical protein [Hyphomicrobiales bacterium]NRB14986.1 hypothetical protein [Hyphomicrobiales bacterium]
MANEVAEFKSKIDSRYNMAVDQLVIILAENDSNVNRSASSLMSNHALMYKQQDLMKYAITCHNKHISLHLMPIYCYADIHKKFNKIIKSGKFQKGCINFADYNNLPLTDIAQLIAECAAAPYPTQYQLDRK